MKAMRRSDRQLPVSEGERLLHQGEYGVMATVGSDQVPYAVPVSYVFHKGVVYIHSAKEGHKLENIDNNPRVSLCVVGKTCVLPSQFSTEYESVIVFGEASRVLGEEKREALTALVAKYSPGYESEGERYIAGALDEVEVLRVTVKELTAKGRR